MRISFVLFLAGLSSAPATEGMAYKSQVFETPYPDVQSVLPPTIASIAPLWTSVERVGVDVTITGSGFEERYGSGSLQCVWTFDAADTTRDDQVTFTPAHRLFDAEVCVSNVQNQDCATQTVVCRAPFSNVAETVTLAVTDNYNTRTVLNTPSDVAQPSEGGFCPADIEGVLCPAWVRQPLRVSNFKYFTYLPRIDTITTTEPSKCIGRIAKSVNYRGALAEESCGEATQSMELIVKGKGFPVPGTAGAKIFAAEHQTVCVSVDVGHLGLFPPSYNHDEAMVNGDPMNAYHIFDATVVSATELRCTLPPRPRATHLSVGIMLNFYPDGTSLYMPTVSSVGNDATAAAAVGNASNFALSVTNGTHAANGTVYYTFNGTNYTNAADAAYASNASLWSGAPTAAPSVPPPAAFQCSASTRCNDIVFSGTGRLFAIVPYVMDVSQTSIPAHVPVRVEVVGKGFGVNQIQIVRFRADTIDLANGGVILELPHMMCNDDAGWPAAPPQVRMCEPRRTALLTPDMSPQKLTQQLTNAFGTTVRVNFTRPSSEDVANPILPMLDYVNDLVVKPRSGVEWVLQFSDARVNVTESTVVGDYFFSIPLLRVIEGRIGYAGNSTTAWVEPLTWCHFEANASGNGLGGYSPSSPSSVVAPVAQSTNGVMCETPARSLNDWRPNFVTVSADDGLHFSPFKIASAVWQTPCVLKLQPTLFSPLGGEQVHVFGSHFLDLKTLLCHFVAPSGGAVNSSAIWVSDEHIICTTPALTQYEAELGEAWTPFSEDFTNGEDTLEIPSAHARLEVSNDGVHASKWMLYRNRSLGAVRNVLEYWIQPRLEMIEPRSGPQSGGTRITIRGRHFLNTAMMRCVFDLGGTSIVSAEEQATLAKTGRPPTMTRAEYIDTNHVVCDTPPQLSTVVPPQPVEVIVVNNFLEIAAVLSSGRGLGATRASWGRGRAKESTAFPDASANDWDFLLFSYEPTIRVTQLLFPTRPQVMSHLPLRAPIAAVSNLQRLTLVSPNAGRAPVGTLTLGLRHHENASNVETIVISADASAGAFQQQLLSLNGIRDVRVSRVPTLIVEHQRVELTIMTGGTTSNSSTVCFTLSSIGQRHPAYVDSSGVWHDAVPAAAGAMDCVHSFVIGAGDTECTNCVNGIRDALTSDIAQNSIWSCAEDVNAYKNTPSTSDWRVMVTLNTSLSGIGFKRYRFDVKFVDNLLALPSERPSIGLNLRQMAVRIMTLQVGVPAITAHVSTVQDGSAIVPAGWDIPEMHRLVVLAAAAPMTVLSGGRSLNWRVDGRLIIRLGDDTSTNDNVVVTAFDASVAELQAQIEKIPNVTKVHVERTPTSSGIQIEVQTISISVGTLIKPFVNPRLNAWVYLHADSCGECGNYGADGYTWDYSTSAWSEQQNETITITSLSSCCLLWHLDEENAAMNLERALERFSFIKDVHVEHEVEETDIVDEMGTVLETDVILHYHIFYLAPMLTPSPVRFVANNMTATTLASFSSRGSQPQLDLNLKDLYKVGDYVQVRYQRYENQNIAGKRLASTLWFDAVVTFVAPPPYLFNRNGQLSQQSAVFYEVIFTDPELTNIIQNDPNYAGYVDTKGYGTNPLDPTPDPYFGYLLRTRIGLLYEGLHHTGAVNNTVVKSLVETDISVTGVSPSEAKTVDYGCENCYTYDIAFMDALGNTPNLYVTPSLAIDNGAVWPVTNVGVSVTTEVLTDGSTLAGGCVGCFRWEVEILAPTGAMKPFKVISSSLDIAGAMIEIAELRTGTDSWRAVQLPPSHLQLEIRGDGFTVPDVELLDDEPAANTNAGAIFNGTAVGLAVNDWWRLRNKTTGSPTGSPTVPTSAPTETPTHAPSTSPTSTPTTVSPSMAPTQPTNVPTKAPTVTDYTYAPTVVPSAAPTTAPTVAPTNAPSEFPTEAPTLSPTAPTKAPTRAPTVINYTYAPSSAPSASPTTSRPTSTGYTYAPSVAPTEPTGAPSMAPTTAGFTWTPSATPSAVPTVFPTIAPTLTNFTYAPTVEPTAAPTRAPTTMNYTYTPSTAPTESPTNAPSTSPSAAPSRPPTHLPTHSIYEDRNVTLALAMTGFYSGIAIVMQMDLAAVDPRLADLYSDPARWLPGVNRLLVTETSLLGRSFSQTGDPTTELFPVAEQPIKGIASPAVDRLYNGWVAVWQSWEKEDRHAMYNTSSYEVYLRIFDTECIPFSPPVVVERLQSADSEMQPRPRVAKMMDGFAVAWINSVATIRIKFWTWVWKFDIEQIKTTYPYAQRENFTARGSPNGPQDFVEINDANSTEPFAMCETERGIAVAWVLDTGVGIGVTAFQYKGTTYDFPDWKLTWGVEGLGFKYPLRGGPPGRNRGANVTVARGDTWTLGSDGRETGSFGNPSCAQYDGGFVVTWSDSAGIWSSTFDVMNDTFVHYKRWDANAQQNTSVGVLEPGWEGPTNRDPSAWHDPLNDPATAANVRYRSESEIPTYRSREHGVFVENASKLVNNKTAWDVWTPREPALGGHDANQTWIDNLYRIGNVYNGSLGVGAPLCIPIEGGFAVLWFMDLDGSQPGIWMKRFAMYRGLAGGAQEGQPWQVQDLSLGPAVRGGRALSRARYLSPALKVVSNAARLVPVATNLTHKFRGFALLHGEGDHVYISRFHDRLRCRVGSASVPARFHTREKVTCLAPDSVEGSSVVVGVAHNGIDFVTFNKSFIVADGSKGLCSAVSGQYCADTLIAQTCPIGHQCSGAGSMHAEPCPRGTFARTEGHDRCELCNIGYMCPFPGMREQLICEAGFVCHEAGTIFPNFECPPGHFCRPGVMTKSEDDCAISTSGGEIVRRSADPLRYTGTLICYDSNEKYDIIQNLIMSPYPQASQDAPGVTVGAQWHRTPRFISAARINAATPDIMSVLDTRDAVLAEMKPGTLFLICPYVQSTTVPADTSIVDDFTEPCNMRDALNVLHIKDPEDPATWGTYKTYTASDYLNDGTRILFNGVIDDFKKQWTVMFPEYAYNASYFPLVDGARGDVKLDRAFTIPTSWKGDHPFTTDLSGVVANEALHKAFITNGFIDVAVFRQEAGLIDDLRPLICAESFYCSTGMAQAERQECSRLGWDYEFGQLKVDDGRPGSQEAASYSDYEQPFKLSDAQKGIFTPLEFHCYQTPQLCKQGYTCTPGSETPTGTDRCAPGQYCPQPDCVEPTEEGGLPSFYWKVTMGLCADRNVYDAYIRCQMDVYIAESRYGICPNVNDYNVTKQIQGVNMSRFEMAELSAVPFMFYQVPDLSNFIVSEHVSEACTFKKGGRTLTVSEREVDPTYGCGPKLVKLKAKYGNNTDYKIEDVTCTKQVQPRGACPCPRGYICTDFGNVVPTRCAPGTYNDVVEAETCKSCLIGHFCPGAAEVKPTPCTEGRVCEEAQRSDPTGLCPAGFFCLEGVDDNPYKIDLCTACDKELFNSDDANKAVSACGERNVAQSALMTDCGEMRLNNCTLEAAEQHIAATWKVPLNATRGLLWRELDKLYTIIEAFRLKYDYGRDMNSSYVVGSYEDQNNRRSEMWDPLNAKVYTFMDFVHANVTFMTNDERSRVERAKRTTFSTYEILSTSGMAFPCSSGYYCNEGTSTAIPGLKFHPDRVKFEFTSPQACLGGTYCQCATTSPSARSCGVGNFCRTSSKQPEPAGFGEFSSNTENRAPEECSPGFFSATTGTKACTRAYTGFYVGEQRSKSMTTCEEGFACNQVQLSSYEGLFCVPGHYCLNGTASVCSSTTKKAIVKDAAFDFLLEYKFEPSDPGSEMKLRVLGCLKEVSPGVQRHPYSAVDLIWEPSVKFFPGDECDVTSVFSRGDAIEVGGKPNIVSSSPSDLFDVTTLPLAYSYDGMYAGMDITKIAPGSTGFKLSVFRAPCNECAYDAHCDSQKKQGVPFATQLDVAGSVQGDGEVYNSTTDAVTVHSNAFHNDTAAMLYALYDHKSNVNCPESIALLFDGAGPTKSTVDNACAGAWETNMSTAGPTVAYTRPVFGAKELTLARIADISIYTARPIGITKRLDRVEVVVNAHKMACCWIEMRWKNSGHGSIVLEVSSESAVHEGNETVRRLVFLPKHTILSVFDVQGTDFETVEMIAPDEISVLGRRLSDATVIQTFEVEVFWRTEQYIPGYTKMGIEGIFDTDSAFEHCCRRPLSCKEGTYCLGGQYTNKIGYATEAALKVSGLFDDLDAFAGNNSLMPSADLPLPMEWQRSDLMAQWCNPGGYCMARTISSQGTKPCPAGFYCPAGSARPRPCWKGHSCPDRNNQIPRPCSAGSFSNLGVWPPWTQRFTPDSGSTYWTRTFNKTEAGPRRCRDPYHCCQIPCKKCVPPAFPGGPMRDCPLMELADEATKSAPNYVPRFIATLFQRPGARKDGQMKCTDDEGELAYLPGCDAPCNEKAPVAGCYEASGEVVPYDLEWYPGSSLWSIAGENHSTVEMGQCAAGHISDCDERCFNDAQCTYFLPYGRCIGKAASNQTCEWYVPAAATVGRAFEDKVVGAVNVTAFRYANSSSSEPFLEAYNVTTPVIIKGVWMRNCSDWFDNGRCDKHPFELDVFGVPTARALPNLDCPAFWYDSGACRTRKERIADLKQELIKIRPGLSCMCDTCSCVGRDLLSTSQARGYSRVADWRIRALDDTTTVLIGTLLGEMSTGYMDENEVREKGAPRTYSSYSSFRFSRKVCRLMALIMNTRQAKKPGSSQLSFYYPTVCTNQTLLGPRRGDTSKLPCDESWWEYSTYTYPTLEAEEAFFGPLSKECPCTITPERLRSVVMNEPIEMVDGVTAFTLVQTTNLIVDRCGRLFENDTWFAGTSLGGLTSTNIEGVGGELSMWDNPMVRDDEWPFLAIVTDVVYNFEANLGIQKAPTRKWVEVSQHYRPFPDAAINKDVGWTFAFGSCATESLTRNFPRDCRERVQSPHQPAITHAWRMPNSRMQTNLVFQSPLKTSIEIWFRSDPKDEEKEYTLASGEQNDRAGSCKGYVELGLTPTYGCGFKWRIRYFTGSRLERPRVSFDMQCGLRGVPANGYMGTLTALLPYSHARSSVGGRPLFNQVLISMRAGSEFSDDLNTFKESGGLALFVNGRQFDSVRLYPKQSCGGLVGRPSLIALGYDTLSLGLTDSPFVSEFPPFVGYIGIVRFYHRRMTQPEVEMNYDTVFSPTTRVMKVTNHRRLRHRQLTLCPNGVTPPCSDDDPTTDDDDEYAVGNSDSISVGGSVCLKCPLGHVCPSAGMPIAFPCPAGSFRDSSVSALQCDACPAGTFALETAEEKSSKSACTPCRDSVYCKIVTFNPGNNSLVEIPCPGGFYCPVGTSPITRMDNPCPAGYYCREGTRPPSDFNEQGAGHWVSRDGKFKTNQECQQYPPRIYYLANDYEFYVQIFAVLEKCKWQYTGTVRNVATVHGIVDGAPHVENETLTFLLPRGGLAAIVNYGEDEQSAAEEETGTLYLSGLQGLATSNKGRQLYFEASAGQLGLNWYVCADSEEKVLPYNETVTFNIQDEIADRDELFFRALLVCSRPSRMKNRSIAVDFSSGPYFRCASGFACKKGTEGTLTARTYEQCPVGFVCPMQTPSPLPFDSQRCRNYCVDQLVVSAQFLLPAKMLRPDMLISFDGIIGPPVLGREATPSTAAAQAQVGGPTDPTDASEIIDDNTIADKLYGTLMSHVDFRRELAMQTAEIQVHFAQGSCAHEKQWYFTCFVSTYDMGISGIEDVNSTSGLHDGYSSCGFEKLKFVSRHSSDGGSATNSTAVPTPSLDFFCCGADCLGERASMYHECKDRCENFQMTFANGRTECVSPPVCLDHKLDPSHDYRTPMNEYQCPAGSMTSGTNAFQLSECLKYRYCLLDDQVVFRGASVRHRAKGIVLASSNLKVCHLLPEDVAIVGTQEFRIKAASYDTVNTEPFLPSDTTSNLFRNRLNSEGVAVPFTDYDTLKALTECDVRGGDSCIEFDRPTPAEWSRDGLDQNFEIKKWGNAQLTLNPLNEFCVFPDDVLGANSGFDIEGKPEVEGPLAEALSKLCPYDCTTMKVMTLDAMFERYRYYEAIELSERCLEHAQDETWMSPTTPPTIRAAIPTPGPTQMPTSSNDTIPSWLKNKRNFTRQQAFPVDITEASPCSLICGVRGQGAVTVAPRVLPRQNYRFVVAKASTNRRDATELLPRVKVPPRHHAVLRFNFSRIDPSLEYAEHWKISIFIVNKRTVPWSLQPHPITSELTALNALMSTTGVVEIVAWASSFPLEIAVGIEILNGFYTQWRFVKGFEGSLHVTMKKPRTRTADGLASSYFAVVTHLSMDKPLRGKVTLLPTNLPHYGFGTPPIRTQGGIISVIARPDVGLWMDPLKRTTRGPLLVRQPLNTVWSLTAAEGYWLKYNQFHTCFENSLDINMTGKVSAAFLGSASEDSKTDDDSDSDSVISCVGIECCASVDATFRYDNDRVDGLPWYIAKGRMAINSGSTQVHYFPAQHASYTVMNRVPFISNCYNLGTVLSFDRLWENQELGADGEPRCTLFDQSTPLSEFPNLAGLALGSWRVPSVIGGKIVDVRTDACNYKTTCIYEDYDSAMPGEDAAYWWTPRKNRALFYLGKRASQREIWNVGGGESYSAELNWADSAAVSSAGFIPVKQIISENFGTDWRATIIPRMVEFRVLYIQKTETEKEIVSATLFFTNYSDTDVDVQNLAIYPEFLRRKYILNVRFEALDYMGAVSIYAIDNVFSYIVLFISALAAFAIVACAGIGVAHCCWLQNTRSEESTPELPPTVLPRSNGRACGEFCTHIMGPMLITFLLTLPAYLLMLIPFMLNLEVDDGSIPFWFTDITRQVPNDFRYIEATGKFLIESCKDRQKKGGIASAVNCIGYAQMLKNMKGRIGVGLITTGIFGVLFGLQLHAIFFQDQSPLHFVESLMELAKNPKEVVTAAKRLISDDRQFSPKHWVGTHNAFVVGFSTAFFSFIYRFAGLSVIQESAGVQWFLWLIAFKIVLFELGYRQWILNQVFHEFTLYLPFRYAIYLFELFILVLCPELLACMFYIFLTVFFNLVMVRTCGRAPLGRGYVPSETLGKVRSINTTDDNDTLDSESRDTQMHVQDCEVAMAEVSMSVLQISALLNIVPLVTILAYFPGASDLRPQQAIFLVMLCPVVMACHWVVHALQQPRIHFFVASPIEAIFGRPNSADGKGRGFIKGIDKLQLDPRNYTAYSHGFSIKFHLVNFYFGFGLVNLSYGFIAALDGTHPDIMHSVQTAIMLPLLLMIYVVTIIGAKIILTMTPEQMMNRVVKGKKKKKQGGKKEDVLDTAAQEKEDAAKADMLLHNSKYDVDEADVLADTDGDQEKKAVLLAQLRREGALTHDIATFCNILEGEHFVREVEKWLEDHLKELDAAASMHNDKEGMI